MVKLLKASSVRYSASPICLVEIEVEGKKQARQVVARKVPGSDR
jgi:hypothetical protein